MAKQATVGSIKKKVKIKRKGRHSKKKSLNSNSKTYKKIYNAQG